MEEATMRHAPRTMLALGLVSALALSACADEEGDDADDPGGSSPTETTSPSAAVAEGEVTYAAVEYGFDGPQTLAAGETTITLVNEGQEPHEMVLFPVEEGRGPQDVLDYIAENPKLDGPPPDWVLGEGAGTFAKPGKTAKPVTAELEPGSYLAVCFVSTKQSDGKPHASLGMIQEITVE
jgi:hypothetical protein